MWQLCQIAISATSVISSLLCFLFVCLLFWPHDFKMGAVYVSIVPTYINATTMKRISASKLLHRRVNHCAESPSWLFLNWHIESPEFSYIIIRIGNKTTMTNLDIFSGDIMATTSGPQEKKKMDYNKRIQKGIL